MFVSQQWLIVLQTILGIVQIDPIMTISSREVLSLLNANFSDQQDHFLLDYVELSLMHISIQ